MRPVDVRNEAWADIQGRLDGCRREVYVALLRYGPQTTRELAALMRWDPFNVRPRVTELAQLGLARLAGREGREGLYEAVALAEARSAFERAKTAAAEQILLKV